MKRAVLILIPLPLALCWITQPTMAQTPGSNGRPDRHVSRPGKPTDSEYSEKEKKRQIELEYEARMEADRRRYYESRRRYHESLVPAVSDVVVITSDTTVSTGPALSADDEYLRARRAAEQRQTKSMAGVLFAPRWKGTENAGVGLMWLGAGGHGAALWLSGSLVRDDRIIETSIPHPNYYTEETRGTWGLRYLHGIGNGPVSLLLGVGVAVDQIVYTDVSNATGWRWEGGEKYVAKLAGQAGCRIAVGNSVALHLGYDSSHRGFIGLAGEF